MQKITVEITANGYTGLTAENIEKALDYYFGSPTLKVSFSVEAAQQSVHLTPDGPCPECGKLGGSHLWSCKTGERG